MTKAGINVLVPQLDIKTVAAGGGSRLFYRLGMLHVGPEVFSDNSCIIFFSQLEPILDLLAIEKVDH